MDTRVVGDGLVRVKNLAFFYIKFKTNCEIFIYNTDQSLHTLFFGKISLYTTFSSNKKNAGFFISKLDEILQNLNVTDLYYRLVTIVTYATFAICIQLIDIFVYPIKQHLQKEWNTYEHFQTIIWFIIFIKISLIIIAMFPVLL